MGAACDRRLASQAVNENTPDTGGGSKESGGGGFRPYGNEEIEPRPLSNEHRAKLAAAARGRSKTRAQRRAISEGMRDCSNAGGDPAAAADALRERLVRANARVSDLTRRLNNAPPERQNDYREMLNAEIRRRNILVNAIQDLDKDARQAGK